MVCHLRAGSYENITFPEDHGACSGTHAAMPTSFARMSQSAEGWLFRFCFQQAMHTCGYAVTMGDTSPESEFEDGGTGGDGLYRVCTGDECGRLVTGDPAMVSSWMGGS